MQRYPLEERPGAKDGTRPTRIIAIRKMSSARSQGEKARQVKGIVVSRLKEIHEPKNRFTTT